MESSKFLSKAKALHTGMRRTRELIHELNVEFGTVIEVPTYAKLREAMQEVLIDVEARRIAFECMAEEQRLAVAREPQGTPVHSAGASV